MLAFAPDRVRKRQFWGVLSPIGGRYQLKARFFNTLPDLRKFVDEVLIEAVWKGLKHGRAASS